MEDSGGEHPPGQALCRVTGPWKAAQGSLTCSLSCSSLEVLQQSFHFFC